MSLPAVLEFDRVTFGYGRVPVLREVSLAIHEAEFVAVVGPNGAGKTTLMRLGLGLLEPAHGTVRLFGTPVRRWRDWGRVGYVPQRTSPDPVVPMSVEEVVRTGLAGRLGLLRRPDEDQRRRVAHVLELMELLPLRKESIGRLSGGQQQRALIARALVTGPALLVLDEPTTGVDTAARAVLADALEHLVRREHVAVACISHDPSAFANLADRVLEVQDGRVVEVAGAATGGPGPAAPADALPEERP